MSFAVDLMALREVPLMLDRLADDADAAVVYAENGFAFELGVGVLNRFIGAHAEAAESVYSFFGAVAGEARSLAEAVRSSVSQYELFDADAAAKLDAALPAVSYDRAWRGAQLTPQIPQARLPERLEPSDRLVPLTDYLPEWPYEPAWSDLFSPTNICRDLVMGVNWLAVQLGLADRVYDPLDPISQSLVGNWAGIRACSDMLNNLAFAATDLAINTVWIELRVNAVWQGNAADACWLQLKQLARALELACDPLRQYAAGYLRIVEDIKRLEDNTELIVVDLIDAGVFTAAALASTPTGAGPLLFGGAAMVYAIKAASRINDLLSVIQKAQAVVDAGSADIRRAAGILEFSPLATLPLVPDRQRSAP